MDMQGAEDSDDEDEDTTTTSKSIKPTNPDKGVKKQAVENGKETAKETDGKNLNKD